MRNRAGKTRRSDSLLTKGLEHLTLGRTYLLDALVKTDTLNRGILTTGSSEVKLAKRHLNKSVSFLRQAGRQDHLPRGLLARAALHRKQERFDDADQDLTEVDTIAKRGKMLIFQIDAAIERSRLHLAREEPAAARQSLDRTKQLIQQTEKLYQSHEPDWPEWEPPAYVNTIKLGEIVGYHRRSPDINEIEDTLSRLGE